MLLLGLAVRQRFGPVLLQSGVHDEERRGVREPRVAQLLERLPHVQPHHRPHNGDVLADRRLAEQPTRPTRILELHQPAHERLDVARLDLAEAQPELDAEERGDPLEHLAVRAPRRLTEPARRPALVGLDPGARVSAEADRRELARLAAINRRPRLGA